MKTLSNTIPGYRAYEYLLVLHPHEELRNKIRQIRKDFYEQYKSPSALGGKVHVALVNFVQYEMIEERLMSRLKSVAMGWRPFKVELKDFASFPSHTIYINVTTKGPIQDLVKELRSEAQRLMKLNEEHKPHFIMEPHINVARRLQPWQYEKGWLEYSHKAFTGRFIADSMLLLKRPVGEMNYQILGRLEFQNLPVMTRQGELFA